MRTRLGKLQFSLLTNYILLSLSETNCEYKTALNGLLRSCEILQIRIVLHYKYREGNEDGIDTKCENRRHDTKTNP